MQGKPNLKTVSDDELLRRLSEILKKTRGDEADLIEHLAEVDTRRLYAREAAPSMFEYCTRVLHLSEAEAWLRIRVARASRKHPMLLPMLRDGRLHVTSIVMLAPHLTPGNRQALLKRAVHRTKREIEEIVAEIAPREDAPAVIRKLPSRRGQPAPVPAAQLTPDTVGESDAQLFPDTIAGRDRTLRPDAVAPVLSPETVAPRARPSRIEPSAPARYKVEFTADAELRDMLERLQALMRSSETGGDLAAILKVAVAEKLERLEAKRFAKTKAPRKTLTQTDTTPTRRNIPAPVRRIVHKRDGGRCTFRDKHERRCTRRHDLEFHHRRPYGQGGDHSPDNLTLLCKTHNTLLAEQDYGKQKMGLYRRPRPSADRISESVASYRAARCPGSRNRQGSPQARAPAPGP